MRILVCGAGGFIGGHLVKALLGQGHEVRAVDIKPFDQWWQIHGEPDQGISPWVQPRAIADLREKDECERVLVGDIDHVYNLAADMGGIGFIESHKADCMLSVLINTHLLQAARDAGVKRYLYTSSACVYPQHVQSGPAWEYESVRRSGGGPPGLQEHLAYPADPEDGYGWEKLFSERMCRHFTEDYGLETRVARLHNVYGPHGTWEGGREKAPAAICRKVAEAVNGSWPIEVWGDGQQTRSFMYVDDCIEGLLRIMDGDSAEPVNLGSSELVTIESLMKQVLRIAGIAQYEWRNILDAPQGVRGRNSDNTLILDRYGWEPSTPLSEGLRPTYEWIAEQVRAKVTA
jgi:GDP-D-mannose 3',5'-epimerase